MPEWQYTRSTSTNCRERPDIDLLNDAGEAGWELIAITSNNVAYLKRGPAQQVQSEPAVSRSMNSHLRCGMSIWAPPPTLTDA